MRNMKIGAKIMLGFGVVIALLAAVAVLVIITNTSSISNVEDIEYDSSLQTFGNKMSISMQAMTAPANKMMESTSPENYAAYQTSEAATKQAFTDIFAFIDQHELLEQFRAGLLDAEQKFGVYAEGATELAQINAQMVAEDAIMNAAGEILSSVANSVMDGQMESLDNDIRSKASVSDMQRRAERIQEGADISTLIWSARISARNMILSADVSQAEGVITAMDAAIEAVTVFRDSAQNTSNKEAAQQILDALEPYRAAIVNFVAVATRKAELVAAMPAEVEAAQAAADTVMANIDAAMVAQINNTQDAASMALLIVAILAVSSLVIGVLLALIIMRGITGPLKSMMSWVLQAGETGNLHYSDEEWALCDRLSRNKDEIGQMLKAFGQMMRKFVYYGDALNQIANRDLTVEVETLGSNDTFGVALTQMTDNLNSMFEEINTASSQVSTGSHQVADGAQALAAGSTEQAASVEELSSSIAEVADRTKDNASKATQAAQLANKIKGSAEKGSEQMDDMMKSVKDINEASQSISKVIKTIDDIAFQTNILALNAAVEAARAGQHGKGFAVVAEEVRNLSAKSAQAAKDTESLIADSMLKAEHGVKVAAETASSLTDIVNGVSESTALVTEIARASEEQSMSIPQINIGIDQVAKVVQQNSATAEESAAASEEMSSQSAVLQELISQFQLKNGSASRRYIRSGNRDAKSIMRVDDYQDMVNDDGDFGKY